MIVVIPKNQYGSAYLFWDWKNVKSVYQGFHIKEIDRQRSIIKSMNMEFLVVEASSRTQIPQHLEWWSKQKKWRTPYAIPLLDRRKRPFPGDDYQKIVVFHGH